MTVTFSDTVARPPEALDPQKAFVEYEQYGPFLPQAGGAAILEVGCGDGWFLQYLAARGYTGLRGIDLDEKAVARCRERLGPCVAVAEARAYLDGLPDASLDAIVMNNVIEHFTKDEFLAVVSLVREKLRPRGVFIAKTGNIENPLNLGLFLRDFTHHIGFTRNSLRQALMLCGFPRENVRVLDIRHTAPGALRNLAKQAAFLAASGLVRLIARCMSLRMDSTAKLIFCVAEKEGASVDAGAVDGK